MQPTKFLFQSQLQMSGRAAALLLALALLRCSGPSPTAPAATAERLSLHPSNPQIAQGTAQQFLVRSLSQDGRLTDLTRNVEWRVTTEQGRLLPTPSNGLLESAAPGRYRVTAEYGGRSLTTALTVTTATLTSVSLSPSKPQMAKGVSLAFSATAHFSDGTTQDVTKLSTWSVKDVTGTGVAIINSVGIAQATSVGQARISVVYQAHSASTTLDVTAATLVSLALSPTNPTLAKGSRQTFVATGTFTDGSTQDVSADAEWAVSDLLGSGVAAIDGTGAVTALAIGEASVSATYAGKAVQTTLTVTAAAVVSLAVSPSAATLPRGSSQSFAATARFSDGTTQDVTDLATWTATDLTGIGVASISSTGVATAHAVGTATIAGSYHGSSGSATLQVTPAALIALVVQPEAASIAKGLSQSFLATGHYTDGSQQDLTKLVAWTAADVVGTNVASISAAGVAVGKNIGQATLTATYQERKAIATLTVTPAKVISLTLSPTNASVLKGATLQFHVTGTLSDGTTKDLTTVVTWTATDVAPSTGVATVSSSGLAAGNQGGQAIIDAQYQGLDVRTVLTVQSGWVPQSSGSDRELYSIWGSDANNIWTVGETGAILKWNGTRWAAQITGSAETFLGVWGLDARNVWAVGTNGTVLYWDGSSWSLQPTDFPDELHGVWASDVNNAWAAGDFGTILQWDGSSWSSLPFDAGSGLVGIWGSDADHVWAVGESGAIAMWTGRCGRCSRAARPRICSA